MIPGGFSAGDEPEGSAKFIAAVFKNPRIKEAVSDLIENRDGLMLGICNGFQALVKLGLLPYGSIRELSDTDPTLTFNTLGRHIACYVETRVSSVLSPWMANVEVGEKHKIAISHGEGRFVADDQLLKTLIDGGQVSTQYVDHLGMATHRAPFNPNGSVMAIEGISSADGRILGKMGHSERTGEDIARNIPGAKDQQLFAAGVKYFSL
jgi:phosphoribosylformylglycinamidine synthase